MSSFYLLSCNASTKSPGAGHSSNNALDRFHFPRLPTHLKPGSAVQHLSPSSCAASHFIFSQQNFSAPSVAPGHVHEAHAVCAVAARTVLARQPSLVYRLLSGARACALSIFLPTHWSTQLVHPPTCPSSKAEPHCCQIHPNPSRLIAVEWDPENSLLTTLGTSGHSSGQILTSRQSNAFAATIHQRCEEGERCKGEEPSYTDQPTPVKLHYNPFQSPCFCITK